MLAPCNCIVFCQFCCLGFSHPIKSLYVKYLLSICFLLFNLDFFSPFGCIAGGCLLLEDKSWYAVPLILGHCLLVVYTEGIMESEYFFSCTK